MLANVLLFLINGFSETAVIPKTLKMTIVKPLYKGGRKDKVENYRPISILPVLSQILEKFLYECMTSFLMKFSILSPRQFGFVANRGTTALLEEFSDEVHSAFENNLFTCALFLDIAKAFDTVNHNILLAKLTLMGFRGPFHNVLRNYMCGRSQIVMADKETVSSKQWLTAGVPQGSILSPLLFNIFVNDLPLVISKGTIYQYADDTVILTKHINYERAVAALQNTIHSVMHWFAKNCINVNIKKTQLTCFRNPLKTTTINIPVFLHDQHCVSCTCAPVQYVDCVRYLGLFIDSSMSWQHHLAYLCGKLRSVAWLLFNIKGFTPLSVKKTIVHALAYSILRYGITVFAFCALRWQTRIVSLLKKYFETPGLLLWPGVR